MGLMVEVTDVEVVHSGRAAEAETALEMVVGGEVVE